MAPTQVVRWIKQAYPKPVVNSEWLDACCAWIADEMQLNPNTQADAFIAEVENQLLESDLRDSMEPGTGFPQNAPAMNNQRIRGSPHILVEVTAITEIGHSAFSLHNVRQVRIERADLAGLAQEESAEDDEGPIPDYPRSMLRLELSDGSVTMPGIEYRSIPGLKLDETPLGFKILLKDVLVRRGVIFLEPKGIVLKGHKNSDRDDFRDRDFLHGLLRRMMKPIPLDDQQDNENNDENQPPPNPPAPPPSQGAALPARRQVRSPLREISEPPEPPVDGMDMDDDANLPRRRRIPSSSASSANTLVASRFFSTGASSSTAVEATTQRLARVLSPVRGDPIDITDSSMEDPIPFSIRPSASSSSTIPHSPNTTNKQASSFSSARGSASVPLRSKISYEDFEFDDDDAELDAAFLDEIAKVEREALSKNQSVSRAVTASHSSSQLRTRVQPRTTEKSRVLNTSVASPDPSASSTTPATGARPQVQAARPAIPVVQREWPEPQPQPRAKPDSGPPQEVITIEDEEDEEDKENVPLPKRRVRRRVSIPPPMDVIDISD